MTRVLIKWEGGSRLRWLCRVLGHVATMSNPACYDCSRCRAVGLWQYDGHTAYCYTKYSEGRCYCNPPRPL